MAALHHGIVESTVWQQEQDTQAFAQQLANALLALQPAGDALIELRGNLGAGKTTLARRLLQALGVAGRIKSPPTPWLKPIL
jgi:tRNA threonylcarbamoyladenosine biosynthesis protein TsaE